MPSKKITIPGKPQAAKRPRFSRRSGRAYMPHQEAEDFLTNKIALQWTRPTLACPVELHVYYGMQMPKSLSKKKTIALGGMPHTKRPDLDNFLKLLLDSMLGVVYDDDGQVYRIVVEKRWAVDGVTVVDVIWSDD